MKTNFNRNEARAYIETVLGKGYDLKQLPYGSFEDLRNKLEQYLKASGLCNKTLKLSKKEVWSKNYIQFFCNSSYWKNREAVTINFDDQFIGMAGWADDTNIRPFINAVVDWIDDFALSSLRYVDSVYIEPKYISDEFKEQFKSALDDQKEVKEFDLLSPLKNFKIDHSLGSIPVVDLIESKRRYFDLYAKLINSKSGAKIEFANQLFTKEQLEAILLQYRIKFQMYVSGDYVIVKKSYMPDAKSIYIITGITSPTSFSIAPIDIDGGVIHIAGCMAYPEYLRHCTPEEKATGMRSDIE